MTRQSITRWIAIVPVSALALALGGCADAPQPEPTQVQTSTPSAGPTPTQAPAEPVFRLPAECTGLLPDAQQRAFAAEGIDLLGGPGGKYPDYYADPTPEERAGGISCIWGDEAAPETTVTVSAAPLTASTRGIVVEDLLAQGLNEAVIDDGISYAQIGDDNSAPAVLNIIRDDSWISVIQARGGEASFGAAVELADAAAEQVYVG